MGTIAYGLEGHEYGFFTSTASAAQHELLANAVANVLIRVTSMIVTCGGAQQITFGTDEVAISGIHNLVAGSPFILPYNRKGWFRTLAAEPLDVLLGQATVTGFTFTYLLSTV